MPGTWINDKPTDRGETPVAERPDRDPLTDGNGDYDDLLSVDYRREDRDSVFDGRDD